MSVKQILKKAFKDANVLSTKPLFCLALGYTVKSVFDNGLTLEYKVIAPFSIQIKTVSVDAAPWRFEHLHKLYINRYFSRLGRVLYHEYRNLYKDDSNYKCEKAILDVISTARTGDK